jgi:glycerophosphoryl diester phosphodiesterase
MPDGSIIKENSLEAFSAAVKENAEIIEFDVERELYICHDPDIPAEAPKLEDVLNLVAGKSILNIEIKCPSATEATCDLLEKALESAPWKPDQFVISSFNHQVILRCRKRLPTIKIGALFDAVVLPEYISLVAANGINNIHIEWRSALMDMNYGQTMATVAKNHGLEIWVYTVNSKPILDRITKYGANVIFTDFPEIGR